MNPALRRRPARRGALAVLTPAQRRRSARAFTLLELIVVIVVLGILALLAIPTFFRVIQKSKAAVAEQTLAAVGRDAQALAALDQSAITTSDITTAIGELPSAAAAPAPLAAASGYSATTGASTGPGVISYAISSGGSAVGLSMLVSGSDAAYALVSASGPVQTWDGCAAATGTQALSGEAATSSCTSSGSSGSSGSSSSGYGSGGPVVVNPPPSGTSGSYTGSPIVYTVPSGASYVQVTAAGAQGGGNGGEVSAAVPVSAGQTLYAYLGQQPTGSAAGTVSGAPGSFGEGGEGWAGYGIVLGGGGGATSVFLTDNTAPAAPIASNLGGLVAVAGGGGGGGGGGTGGNPATAGTGAGAATQTAAGSGSAAGGFGRGGSSSPPPNYFGGGGGGGGLYGGGGSSGSNSDLGGGGGGGSSWVESAASGTVYDNGVNTGNGTVSFRPVGAAAPAGLTATYDASTGDVALSWTASPSTNVTGYVIYRNGTQLATVSGASTASYTDTSAPQASTVTYGVAATTSGLSSVTVTANVSTSSYGQAVLADHPAAYWPLNETSGTVAADASGNGSAGSYQGSYTLDGATTPWGAPTVSLTGGDVTTPYVQSSVTSYSEVVWVKTTTTTSQAVLVDDRGSGSGLSLTLNLNNCPGLTATVCFGLDTNNTYAGVGSTAVVNNGTWHQIVAVWAGTPGSALTLNQLSIYVDGKLASTEQFAVGSTTSPLTGSSGTVLANSAQVSGWNPYTGDLAGVALFTSALSAAQVSALYSTGIRA